MYAHCALCRSLLAKQFPPFLIVYSISANGFLLARSPMNRITATTKTTHWRTICVLICGESKCTASCRPLNLEVCRTRLASVLCGLEHTQRVHSHAAKWLERLSDKVTASSQRHQTTTPNASYHRSPCKSMLNPCAHPVCGKVFTKHRQHRPLNRFYEEEKNETHRPSHNSVGRLQAFRSDTRTQARQSIENSIEPQIHGFCLVFGGVFGSRLFRPRGFVVVALPLTQRHQCR